jgi:Catalytic LigB subunit of aromatic ring-opening dioxygenase
MAQLIGGIGASHSPRLAQIHDRGLQQDPAWAPIFAGYAPAKEWLERAAPDLLVVIYNDHVNQFFFDAYPTFALGVGERHGQADEGFGRRDLPDLAGNPEFGWHLAHSLIADEFDPTICQEMVLDHGVLGPLPLLCDRPWPAPVVPLAVNVIQHPLPTARRLWKLGRALRRAIHTYPPDVKVAILGTGGLSHQVQGTRAGFVNPAWDNEFLDLLEREPEALTGLDHHTYMERGGAEGVEMIMWLGMRGALASQVRVVHRFYAAPATLGYGVVVYEEAAGVA